MDVFFPMLIQFFSTISTDYSFAPYNAQLVVVTFIDSKYTEEYFVSLFEMFDCRSYVEF